MNAHAVSKEDEATLREIVRSVDKKLDYSLQDGNDPEGPGLILHLSRQGWKNTMILRVDDLREAKTDLLRRNKIRQRIKRLRDHMWDGALQKDVLGTLAAGMLRESGQSEDAHRRQFTRRPPRR